GPGGAAERRLSDEEVPAAESRARGRGESGVGGLGGWGDRGDVRVGGSQKATRGHFALAAGGGGAGRGAGRPGRGGGGARPGGGREAGGRGRPRETGRVRERPHDAGARPRV